MNTFKDTLQEASDKEVLSVVYFFITAISILLAVPIVTIILVIGLL